MNRLDTARISILVSFLIWITSFKEFNGEPLTRQLCIGREDTLPRWTAEKQTTQTSNHYSTNASFHNSTVTHCKYSSSNPTNTSHSPTNFIKKVYSYTQDPTEKTATALEVNSKIYFYIFMSIHGILIAAIQETKLTDERERSSMGRSCIHNPLTHSIYTQPHLDG